MDIAMDDVISVEEKKNDVQKRYDVASLLSNPEGGSFVMRCRDGEKEDERVPVEELVGKYLVVICLFLRRSDESDDLEDSYNSVIHLCSELATKVEVLVVIKPTPDEKDEEHLTQVGHFLSWFEEFDLEIVFVNLPFIDFRSDFRIKLNSNKVQSWLDCPTDYDICRPLWRYCDMCHHDRLIVLPPGGQPPDLNGRSVIKKYGIEAYPFTRWNLLGRKIKSFNSLTLESLLCLEGDVPLFRTDRRLYVPLSELRGRRVLLYSDYFDERNDKRVNFLMRERFPDFKKEHPDAEVVVASLSSPAPLVQFASMPWLMVPATCSNLTKYRNEFYRAVTFGANGRLLTLNAVPNLCEDVASLFEDELGEGIARGLADLGLVDAD